MIADERVENEVLFIGENAERLGDLIGHCKGLEYQAKVIKAQAFLEALGTVQARESEALCTPEYKAIVEDIENAWAERVTLETKLKAAELTIDTWRTQQATKRTGHV
jgi:hypothetical protein